MAAAAAASDSGCRAPWLRRGLRGGEKLPAGAADLGGRRQGRWGGRREKDADSRSRTCCSGHRPRRRAREAAARRRQVSPPSTSVVIRAESPAVEQDSLGGLLLLAGRRGPRTSSRIQDGHAL